MENDTCGRPQTFFDARFVLNYAAYNVIPFLYMFFILSGHSLLFCAFLKQLKTEKIYIYQVYAAGSDTAVVFFRLLYLLSMQIATYNPAMDARTLNTYQESLTKCFACVWYLTRLAVPMAATMMILALLLSVAMAADRVLSLLLPVKYQTWNHRVWRRLILIACIIVSFSISAFDIMRLKYTPAGQDRYTISVDVAYMGRAIIAALALVRVYFETIALIVLITLSILLCYLYRTRYVQAKDAITSTEEQRRRKEGEKTLVYLTLLSCSFTIATISIQIIYFALAYTFPVQYACWSPVLTPLSDVVRAFIEGSNFYILLLISKKFRSMVKNVIFGCWKKKQNAVANIVNVQVKN